jgi:hypothetical protein
MLPSFCCSGHWHNYLMHPGQCSVSIFFRSLWAELTRAEQVQLKLANIGNNCGLFCSAGSEEKGYFIALDTQSKTLICKLKRMTDQGYFALAAPALAPWASLAFASSSFFSCFSLMISASLGSMLSNCLFRHWQWQWRSITRWLQFNKCEQTSWMTWLDQDVENVKKHFSWQKCMTIFELNFWKDLNENTWISVQI